MIWTQDVSDILNMNLDSLRKIYNYFVTPTKKYMTLNDAMNLLCKFNDNVLSEFMVRYCFGMCKITVAEENEEGSIKYDRITFVEFLEFICRGAHQKFKGSDMQLSPLETKI